jgi:hypothetical protein
MLGLPRRLPSVGAQFSCAEQRAAAHVPPRAAALTPREAEALALTESSPRSALATVSSRSFRALERDCGNVLEARVDSRRARSTYEIEGRNRPPTRRNGEMRVMVLIKATEQSERGEMPSEKLLTEMTTFNEELVKAGVMLAGDGLHPSAKGVRVAFKGSERKVIDGPFSETKELLAGYWIWQVKSLDEAVEWVKRIPAPDDDADAAIVEIRPVFEAEDFGDEFTPELREREAALRARTEGA